MRRVTDTRRDERMNELGDEGYHIDPHLGALLEKLDRVPPQPRRFTKLRPKTAQVPLPRRPAALLAGLRPRRPRGHLPERADHPLRRRPGARGAVRRLQVRRGPVRGPACVGGNFWLRTRYPGGPVAG